MNKLVSNEDEKTITGTEELIETFVNGCKRLEEYALGFEYEKLPVQKNSCTAALYDTHIAPFLKEFGTRYHWEPIFEKTHIIGLKDGHGNYISLEPGCQTELSTKPVANLLELEKILVDYNQKASDLGKELGIIWLGIGIQPLSTSDNIPLIPKGRYFSMNQYLPSKGSMAKVMMRETAGTQVTIDFSSEEDAINKLKVALGLSPFATAIFANSPIRQGKITNYQSYRAYSWCFTDNDRCGLISPKIFEDDFTFTDYVDYLLDLPMMFLYKHHEYMPLNGKITFRQYIQEGYEGFKATKQDWELYLTTPFPDVRMKNFIEIRSTDSHNTALSLSVAAFWKGIMYSPRSLERSWELVRDFSWDDRENLRKISSRDGLQGKIKDILLLDIAKELMTYAEEGLKDQQEDVRYIHPIKEILFNNISPSDKILSLWCGKWDEDISQLIQYVKI